MSVLLNFEFSIKVFSNVNFPIKLLLDNFLKATVEFQQVSSIRISIFNNGQILLL